MEGDGSALFNSSCMDLSNKVGQILSTCLLSPSPLTLLPTSIPSPTLPILLLSTLMEMDVGSSWPPVTSYTNEAACVLVHNRRIRTIHLNTTQTMLCTQNYFTHEGGDDSLLASRKFSVQVLTLHRWWINKVEPFSSGGQILNQLLFKSSHFFDCFLMSVDDIAWFIVLMRQIL